MRTTTILIALTMLTIGLAGCTGDPDGGGNDEFDAETLQGMIESGLQDFMNNTTVEITTNYYTNETSTTTNYVNGSGGGSSTSLHTITGTVPSSDPQIVSTTEYGMGLLAPNDLLETSGAYHWYDIFNGTNICLGIGSETESLMVDAFSQHGISFTSVPVADNAEARSKFIDGSCDAIAGEVTELLYLEDSIDDDGSIEGGVGVEGIIGGHGFWGYDWIEISIQQESGISTTLLGLYFEVNAVGVCVSNCTAEDEDIVIEFSDIAWVGWPGTDNYYWKDWSSMATLISECENNLTAEYGREISPLRYPGLVCEHTLRFEADVRIDFDILHTSHLQEDYEFTWSDWTYVVHWETTPVTLHE